MVSKKWIALGVMAAMGAAVLSKANAGGLGYEGDSLDLLKGLVAAQHSSLAKVVKDASGTHVLISGKPAAELFESMSASHEVAQDSQYWVIRDNRMMKCAQGLVVVDAPRGRSKLTLDAACVLRVEQKGKNSNEREVELLDEMFENHTKDASFQAFLQEILGRQSKSLTYLLMLKDQDTWPSQAEIHMQDAKLVAEAVTEQAQDSTSPAVKKLKDLADSIGTISGSFGYASFRSRFMKHIERIDTIALLFGKMNRKGRIGFPYTKTYSEKFDRRVSDVRRFIEVVKREKEADKVDDKVTITPASELGADVTPSAAEPHPADNGATLEERQQLIKDAEGKGPSAP